MATAYKPRHHPSKFELIRCTLSDLVTDIRCAEEREQTEYAQKTRTQVFTLFKQRHTTKLDQFGWAACLEQ
jgi:hypothetical protein